MQDIFLDIEHWLKLGLPIGLATVIQTWDSSPRQVGAKMAFTSENRFSGSVSGGCVESAVYEEGIHAITSGEAQLLQFGVSDDLALEVGLSCGGSIEVFIRKLNNDLIQEILDELLLQKGFAIVSILPGECSPISREFVVNETGMVESTIDAKIKNWVEEFVPQYIHSDLSCEIEPNLDDYKGMRLFIDVVNPLPLLVIVGGAHITIPLGKLAKQLSYRTTVIDPRRAFATEERFPEVDQLIQAWPQEAFKQLTITHNTAIAILSHDPKIDDPAIKIALDSPAFYIGALGSRLTHQKRCQRLLKNGVSASQIKRIHSPIGINLGDRTPEEIALSILAEIVQVRYKVKKSTGLTI